VLPWGTSVKVIAQAVGATVGVFVAVHVRVGPPGVIVGVLVGVFVLVGPPGVLVGVMVGVWVLVGTVPVLVGDGVHALIYVPVTVKSSMCHPVEPPVQSLPSLNLKRMLMPMNACKFTALL
jgi:hypothetical protein